MLSIEVTRSEGIATRAVIVSEDCRHAANVEDRNDWKTYEAAVELAKLLGEGYVATDSGPNVSPRFDVIELPKVGDAVSYRFNGDSYPCGYVTSISKTLKKITATEDKNGTKVEHHFFRRRLSGAWIKNGTWGLSPGHVYEQNPSF